MPDSRTFFGPFRCKIKIAEVRDFDLRKKKLENKLVSRATAKVDLRKKLFSA